MAWLRIGVAVPAAVAPGESAVFQFRVTAPAVAGDYDFQWQMVQEGVEFFGEFTPNVVVAVQPRGNAARFVARTVPGKGVPCIERCEKAHFLNVTKIDWEDAIRELEAEHD